MRRIGSAVSPFRRRHRTWIFNHHVEFSRRSEQSCIQHDAQFVTADGLIRRRSPVEVDHAFPNEVETLDGDHGGASLGHMSRSDRFDSWLRRYLWIRHSAAL